MPLDFLVSVASGLALSPIIGLAFYLSKLWLHLTSTVDGRITLLAAGTGLTGSPIVSVGIITYLLLCGSDSQLSFEGSFACWQHQ